MASTAATAIATVAPEGRHAGWTAAALRWHGLAHDRTHRFAADRRHDPGRRFCGGAALRSPQFAPSSASPSSSIPRIAAATIPTASCRWSRLDRNAIRRSEDCFVDELFGAAVPLGAPLLARQFSARLYRRQPRAVGTRPAHVRRAGAVLRQHPLGARRRRARHRAASWSARGSTSIPAGCRWPRRSAASRRSTGPITTR